MANGKTSRKRKSAPTRYKLLEQYVDLANLLTCGTEWPAPAEIDELVRARAELLRAQIAMQQRRAEEEPAHHGRDPEEDRLGRPYRDLGTLEVVLDPLEQPGAVREP